jgi:sarcosine oxidase/L-pipecolate oxidase
MPSTKIYDVAVIGGGVMGSATAYYLSKSCKNVILLEQFDFLHRKGSSHGDSRYSYNVK